MNKTLSSLLVLISVAGLTACGGGGGGGGSSDSSGGSPNVGGGSQKPGNTASGLVVYVADQDVDEKYEIYAFNAASKVSSKLNAPLEHCASLTAVSWAPDKSRIVFSGEQEVSGVNDLFSVRPDGSGLVRLSGGLVAGGTVHEFAVSPDSRRVAF